MRVVDTWTGELADLLRRAFRMTIEEFAVKQLGVAPRTVSYWRQRPSTIPKPEQQAILDTTLERASEAVKARFAMLVDRDSTETPGPKSTVQSPSVDELNRLPSLAEIDAQDVISWVESTNTSQGHIDYLREAAVRAAEEHASQPPGLMIVQVMQLHGMIQTLLRGGKQRYRQTADLIKLDSDVAAHISQLLGDINRDTSAFAYARASIALANDVGASPATAFSAQAQIARWRGRFAEAADCAQEGFKRNPPGPLRTLLVYQEANAAALAGDSPRARRALEKGERMSGDSGTVYSVWTCPPARKALYRIAVTLNMGDPREAVTQAGETEPMWQRERSKAFGTWAHFQISAARAHILTGSLEGAVEHVAPVLNMPYEYHISTLTSHMAALDQLLAAKRFDNSSIVTSFREQIQEFIISTPIAAKEGGAEIG